MNSNAIYNFNINSNHNPNNIEQVRDEARVHQGPVNGKSSMMANRSSSARPDGSIDRNNNQQTEGSAFTTSRLDERIGVQERDAVTHRVNNPIPLKDHYSDYNKHDFHAGEVYRIWHLTNTDVHLVTFLVHSIEGSSMTCLKIVSCEPADVDYRFRRRHRKLMPESDTPHPRRSARNSKVAPKQEDDYDEVYELHLRKEETMIPDCWVDMSNSWCIDWKGDYLFAYCGQLDGPTTVKRAQELHWELYRRI